MNLGLAIKRIRRRRGFTQVELAKKAGFTQTSLSSIETGSTTPHPNTLKNICTALEISEPILYLVAIEASDITENRVKVLSLMSSDARELVLKLLN